MIRVFLIKKTTMEGILSTDRDLFCRIRCILSGQTCGILTDLFPSTNSSELLTYTMNLYQQGITAISVLKVQADSFVAGFAGICDDPITVIDMNSMAICPPPHGLTTPLSLSACSSFFENCPVIAPFKWISPILCQRSVFVLQQRIIS